ncbi:MAG: TonB-dependent receptor [Acidobacteriia bacterium]|nr:TonB-dependent receptor [Terriglobia bacterium]
MPRVLCAVFALLLSLSALPVIHAQVVGATLSGTVTDPSGSTVPNATVEIKAVATGVVRTVTTDTAGLYSVPNLLPGVYEVTGSASGFAKVVQPGVTLTVGAQQELSIKLQVGQVSQTIEVAAQAPQVQLTSSSITATVNETTVRELPLNGRSWTDLATLQPGVANMAAEQPGISGTSSASARGIRGFGNQLTISGGRPGQNNYRLDGISENDYSNSSPGSVTGGAAGVDAIAEFSVVTTNYSAEYGRTSGGVINAITRSGTNQFHGDVYEFLRNSALDAPNFFDAGGKVPPFRRNQFGASGGAPIIKNKTFVFGNYEGLRQSLGTTFKDIVPSAAARNGQIHNSNGDLCTIGIVAGNCTFVNSAGTVGVDPKIVPFLALWHLPTPGLPLLGSGDTGNYVFAAQQVTSENFFTTRVDHRFSDSDSMYGTFLWDHAQGTLPDPLNTVVVGQKTGHTLFTVEEDHTFSPQFLNSIRLGYNRSTAFTGGGLSALNPAAQGAATSAVPPYDAPLLQPTGITFFGGGVNNQSQAHFAWNSYQVYDDAFLTKGKHSIKLGFAFEQMQDNYQQQARVGGLAGFGSLANFLTDIASKFQVTFPLGISPRGLRQSLYAVYVQDDYRLKPNFTLNLGMRYEFTTAPADVKGMLGRLLKPTDAAPTTGNPFFKNPTLRNFEPRLGFAWDPFNNGKTSIRGGIGLFDVLPLAYEYSNFANNSAPFAPQGNVNSPTLAQGDFPANALTKATNPGALRVSYVEPKPHRNYVEQWNFSIQRQLASNLTATVAYIGNHGVHMEFRGDDMNAVQPTLTPAGYLYPCGPNGSGNNCATGFLPTGTQAVPIKSTVLNTNFGRIDNTNWGGDTHYNALTVLVQQTFSHGFQVQGAYTWSKTFDQGSGSYLSDPFNNSISNLFSVDKNLRHSVSDFDVTHNVTMNATWVLPTPKSLGSAAEFALGGWQVGGIVSIRTGLPFTPQIGGDPLGVKTDDFDYPNRSKAAACASAVNPGNPNAYINLSCFSLPVIPSGLTAAQCAPFGVAANGTGGIAGTCANLIGNGGRNSIRGPGLFDLDFSVFKNNYVRRISETFNAQFRAEIFNITNRNNFLSPTANAAIFNTNGAAVGGAGSINGTSTTSRQVQFGLKVIW